MKVSGIISTPEESHEIHGETFYKAWITCIRSSGNIDHLPLMISEVLIPYINTKKVLVYGDIRSRNVDRHLQLYIFVDLIEPYYDETDINEVEVKGNICSIEPQRTTPQGKKITNIILATHRKYHRSDYIPCIAWGNNIPSFEIGDEVTIKGRFQSRIYHNTHEVYEISISELAY